MSQQSTTLLPEREVQIPTTRVEEITTTRQRRAPQVVVPIQEDTPALHGQCNLCGWEGLFLEAARGREGHLCGNCASTSRHRMVIHGLSMVMKMEGLLPPTGSIPLYAWHRDRHLSILEPSGRGVYPTMLADRFEYYGIEYDPERVDPEHPHRGYGDIQNLHFADESFDVVIASDVFEHVRDDDAGYAQIHRVLKQGGALVLTVPYEHEQAETVMRVESSGHEDVHILPAVYHSGGGLTLVYRDYGRDLLTKLRCAGFSVLHLRNEMPELGIPRQDLILAFKKDFVEWVPEASTSSEAAGQGALPKLGPLLPQRLYLLLKFNLAGFAQQTRQLMRRLH